VYTDIAVTDADRDAISEAMRIAAEKRVDGILGTEAEPEMARGIRLAP
jgi:hypothetical protein